MIMRSLILYLFFMAGVLSVFPRGIREEKLEPAILEVVFERTKVLDTLDVANNWKKDLLTLTIGKNVSAFYSKEHKQRDSLEYHNEEYCLMSLKDPNRYKLSHKLPDEVVYKNYPENKVRVLDRYDLCGWVMDEDWEKPEWILTDSVSTILGYECVLAQTDYRGRRWLAWFTPDIPSTEGPWKLCGLPGLILRAHDTRMHYVYEAKSIKTEGIGFVEYFDYNASNRFIEKSRTKGLSRKQAYIHEDLYYMIASSGAFGFTRKGLKKRDTIPNTNYDFEETDYHE